MKINFKLPEVHPLVSTVLTYLVLTLVAWAASAGILVLLYNISFAGMGATHMTYLEALGYTGMSALAIGVFVAVFKETGEK